MGEEKVFREPDNNLDWCIRKVEIKESSLHGRGVFASEAISKHELFERCPVVLFHKSIIDDFRRFHDANRHVLEDYVFSWEGGYLAIALGYGSMYNHSNDQFNAIFSLRPGDDDNDPRIEFMSKRDIAPGEEILIHYLRGRADVDFNNAGTHFIDGKFNSSETSDSQFVHALEDSLNKTVR